MSDNYQHIPVLLKETIEFLNVKKGGTYVDCTLGGGGHVLKLKTQNSKWLDRLAIPAIPSSVEGLKIIGIDRDEDAILAAKQRLAKYENITYFHDNFANIKKIIKRKVDGFLFDLGVSSYQIDESSRGFSLQKDGPLDMRMDRSQSLTAEEIVNHAGEDDLEKIFKDFGEERFARRIAKAITHKRRISVIGATFQLKEIVEKAIPTWKKRESVTRIFQALRIAVNHELDNLNAALGDAISLLGSGGRIVVISYHSLEDRIVKHAFRQASQEGVLKIITGKPVQASDEEMSFNPRAKSAKLRAAEKI